MLFAPSFFLLLNAALPTPRTAVLAVSFRFMVAGTHARPVLNTLLTINDHQRRTAVAIPSSWGGQDSLRNAISELTVELPGRIISDSDGTITIEHPANVPVRIHYLLQQDFAGAARVPLTHRAVLDSERIVFNGENGLLLPDLDNAIPLALSVDWAGVPRDWSVITSFGGARHVVVHTTLNRLQSASFVAGKFRTLARPGPGNDLTIAVQGHWQFTDSALVAMQQRIWRTERALWKSNPFNGAFVVIMPIAQRGTIGGTAFTGGYVAFADTASSLNVLGRLVAHELLHIWNGQALASAQPEGRYKWFTEGFTDYYADRSFRASGAIGDSAFAVAVNGVFRRYYFSPFFGASRDSVSSAYWSVPGMQRYPYTQGYVFAWYLDGELQRGSNAKYSLDSLMHAVLKVGQRTNRRFDDSLLVDAAPATLRPLLRGAVAQFINRGDPIPEPRVRERACLAFAPTAVAPFDLGFDDATSTRERVLRGVRADGPAFRAGLRDGMRMNGWGWNNDDATRNASVTNTDSAGPKKVIYLPAGPEKAIPQLALRC